MDTGPIINLYFMTGEQRANQLGHGTRIKQKYNSEFNGGGLVWIRGGSVGEETGLMPRAGLCRIEF